MSTDLDLQALGVFDAVCELPVQDRPAALVTHCEGNERLQQIVLRMLDEDESSHELTLHLDESFDLLHRAATEFDDAPLPERLGRYRILRVLGRGGMGVVYEAEQTDPKRRVAVKVVHAGLANSETARRFRQEAELLGRLQHSGIAHVY